MRYEYLVQKDGLFGPFTSPVHIIYDNKHKEDIAWAKTENYAKVIMLALNFKEDFHKMYKKLLQDGMKSIIKW